jgi:serine/threonine-protein kinase RsbW
MSAARSVVHEGTVENLPRFLQFIDDVCEDLDAGEDVKYALRLAVEEVCINLIEYGYRGRAPGPIEVVAQDHGDRVTLEIRDRSPPFDPTQAPKPDLTSDAEHRRPGGLGWYLVRQLFDEFRYVADTPSGNVLTVVKRKAK